MSYAFKLLHATHYSAIRKLSITEQYQQVELILGFENHTSVVNYIAKNGDTLIEVTEYNNQLVRDKEYIDMSCEDLFHIWSEAKFSEDLDLEINFGKKEVVNCVYEHFRIHSQTKKSAIYVHSLPLRFENVSQLRTVLTYFNPINLKDLRISSFERNYDIFDFESIVEMDHWKNATKIELHGFSVNTPFESFSHCEDVTMRVSRISADDIRILVNIVSNSSCLKHFCVGYGYLDEHVSEQFLDNLIGEKQTNQSGDLVRLIGNDIEFVHNSEPEKKNIYISKLSDEKEDENIETPKALTSKPSKSAMLCLSNLLITEKIVQHLFSADIIVLRKVSRGSRRCVDFLMPDAKLLAIKISLDYEALLVEVFGGRNDNTSILYIAHEGNIIVNDFVYNHKTDMNNLSEDLVQILKNQKPALKEFCVNFEPGDEWNAIPTLDEEVELCKDQFTEMFQATSSLRGTFLAVEKLNLTTSTLKSAVRILQHMDPLSIKSIELRSTSYHWIIGPDIKELVCLEQWARASELKIENYFLDREMEHLIHFSKADIWLKSLSSEEALYLKEKFLLSSNFRQFKAKLHIIDADDSIFEDNFLGSPFRRVDDISSGLPDIWFFPYKDSMEDLQIRYYQKAKNIMFKRVPRR